jgi:nicotinamide-nucleotide amidase
MEPMLLRAVIPALRRLSAGPARSRTLYVSCCGAPESVLAERLRDLMGRDRDVRVGTAAAGGVVTVSVHGSGEAARDVARVHREVLRRLEDHAYAATRESPGESLVRRLGRFGITVATAESCTAGLVAAALTDLPGSSKVYLGGVVAYSDRLKENLLGVRRRLLAGEGAVSAAAAESMARGVLVRTGADLAVAVTGIAGPGGGTARKPVGLVFLAVASRRGVRSVERRFPGDRAFVRTLAATAAIDLLRREAESLVARP